MKEYLFLFRGGGNGGIQFAPEQMQQWVEWIAEMQQRGQLIHAQPLDNTGKHIWRSGKILNERPFNQEDRSVEGFLVCHADNYETATEIAMGCPVLQFEDGNVEIREVQEIKL
ncbi:MAG: YciI family protein [Flavisolibacter sp.]|jgi:hypothetical protein